jgi:hypothetical protein
LYCEGCETKKRRKQLQKKNEKWQDGGETLLKEKNQQLFRFLSFWCEWPKKERVSKERVPHNTTYGLNGLIFLALLKMITNIKIKK